MNKLSVPAPCGSTASSVGGGDQNSADDEGSRDGNSSGNGNEEEALRADSETAQTRSVNDFTPRAGKRRGVGSGVAAEGGVAARRVHRTWKHFYEEVKKSPCGWVGES